MLSLMDRDLEAVYRQENEKYILEHQAAG